MENINCSEDLETKIFNSSSCIQKGIPHLEIIVQPEKYCRFRYKSEGKSHGCLEGQGYSDIKTYPTVELRNYSGKARIKCKLYEHDKKEEHPYWLYKKEERKKDNTEPCIEVPGRNNYIASFEGLYIMSKLKKDIEECSSHENCRGVNKKLVPKKSKNINLNIVRLRFSAHDVITDKEICEPVFSEWIRNEKNPETNELKIILSSHSDGALEGGTQVLLFVSQVPAGDNNLRIYFFEEDANGKKVWDHVVPLWKNQIYKQYGIHFKTPCYDGPGKSKNKDVKVYFELQRIKDEAKSKRIEFTYRCKRDWSNKRRKLAHVPTSHEFAGENTFIMTPASQNETDTLDNILQNIVDPEDASLTGQQPDVERHNGSGTGSLEEPFPGVETEKTPTSAEDISTEEDIMSFLCHYSNTNNRELNAYLNSEEFLEGYFSEDVLQMNENPNETNMNRQYEYPVGYLEASVGTARFQNGPDFNMAWQSDSVKPSEDKEWHSMRIEPQMDTTGIIISKDNSMRLEPQMDTTGIIISKDNSMRIEPQTDTTGIIISKDNSMRLEPQMDTTGIIISKDNSMRIEPQMDTTGIIISKDNSMRIEPQMDTTGIIISKDNSKSAKKLLEKIFSSGTEKLQQWHQEVRTRLVLLFNIKFSNGNTILHVLLKKHIITFKSLVELVASLRMFELLNKVNDDSQSILHLAIVNGMSDIVPFLIEKGCDVAVRDAWGQSCVQRAVEHGGGALRALLRALPHRPHPPHQEVLDSALALAVELGACGSVRSLLSGGASPLSLPPPLALCGGRHLLRLLLEHVRAEDRERYVNECWCGRTALQVVCARRRAGLVALLLQYKADPYACSEDQEPAWLIAKRDPKLWRVMRPYLKEEHRGEQLSADDEQLLHENKQLVREIKQLSHENKQLFHESEHLSSDDELLSPDDEISSTDDEQDSLEEDDGIASESDEYLSAEETEYDNTGMELSIQLETMKLI